MRGHVDLQIEAPELRAIGSDQRADPSIEVMEFRVGLVSVADDGNRDVRNLPENFISFLIVHVAKHHNQVGLVAHLRGIFANRFHHGENMPRPHLLRRREITHQIAQQNSDHGNANTASGSNHVRIAGKQRAP